MMRRSVLLLTLAAVLVPAAAADARPVIGIADQKSAALEDPRLAGLGLKHARIYLPYDIISDANSLPNADAWFANAKRLGMKPMITIDRSRRPGRQSRNPSVKQIESAVKAWRKRWPGQVKQISAWNEGNINKKPTLVAKWYLAVRRSCKGCLVLGSDLVDRTNAITWARQLQRAAFGKRSKRKVGAWGLHAYNDANTFSTVSIKAFVKGLPGASLHLTETGGVVSRSNPGYRFDGCGNAHAAKATGYLLNTIGKVSSRIKSIYLYHWSIDTGDATFDSAFIGPDGNERPALNVLRAYLGQPQQPQAEIVEPQCQSGSSRPKQGRPKLK